jgi:hypothetical protein
LRIQKRVHTLLTCLEGRKAIDCVVISQSKYSVVIEISINTQEKYTIEQDLFSISNLRDKNVRKKNSFRNFNIRFDLVRIIFIFIGCSCERAK